MTTPTCSRTGIEIDSGDGIWDDGEWLSWEWINSQLEDEPEEEAHFIEPVTSREGFPFSILQQMEIFGELVDCAIRYQENTGRYLQIWGELGEIYAEIKFNLRRHGSHHPGSDGTIDGMLVEVKTISPEKTNNRVQVKRGGNFEKLLIVKISRDYEFQGKLIDRATLREGTGTHYKARFDEK
jgi:hypothetical protein